MWKTDRNRLREEIKKISKEGGTKATFLCVLIAHMRGKIHMPWYNKYHGGWRGYDGGSGWPSTRTPKDVPESMRKAYKDFGETFYKMSAIENLEDQAAWIEAHRGISIRFDLAINEILQRVLIGYPEEEELQKAG